MSDTRSFRTNLTDEEWNEYNSNLKKNGIQVGEEITSKIRQELTLENHKEEEDNATASNHQDRLRDKLKVTDLSHVIMKGSYHVILDDIGLIQTARHDLTMRVTNAVHSAVYRYWIKIWGESQGFTEEQMNTKCALRNLDKFNIAINNIKVTYTVNIPTITLSDLRESDIEHVVQFDCLIIGPTPKKLDTESGKYVQLVLIQEPEGTSKNNNPVMIKALLHGDDTNNIASGMRKKFIGIYTLEPTKEGIKSTKDKTPIIDAITVQDLEEKAEVTLSQYEIDTTREMAEVVPEQYMKGLIDSFCPKILGRELEKKAIYLSMLGGTEIEGYRSNSHLMLCGEADTAKSEMVKFANRVSHKCSIIDGANATGVGILFALDEYDGMRILKRGAMLLNDGGHLVVDEYDKMPKPEQKKLNISMEQQEARYNKAGHIGYGKCRTTIIASCNPVDERWNDDKDMIDNLPFDASTMSRYDLVIRLRHQNNENEIRSKMLHIARRKRGESDHVAAPEWLAGLINYQRALKPVFDEDSEKLLINRFVDFTQIEQSPGSIQIQTRQMEGIQRLCEAWGKMMFKSVITIDIVEDVIRFYQECMATIGMNVEKGITQFDLRGHSTNRDTYFQDVFRLLASEDEEGHVSITTLSTSLQENTSMFNSDHSVSSYIDKRKESGYLFEPKLGVLKKQ